MMCRRGNVEGGDSFQEKLTQPLIIKQHQLDFLRQQFLRGLATFDFRALQRLQTATTCGDASPRRAGIPNSVY